MSFTINLKVENGTTILENATSGDAAPPDGIYSIQGHKYAGEGSANDYVQVVTPFISAVATVRE